jgi:hypothetical protein
MWAAQYLLVPTLSSALEVKPPAMSEYHDGSTMNWRPSPVGGETRYAWERRPLSEDQEHSFPSGYCAVHFDGAVVMWDEAKFLLGRSTPGAPHTWSWAWRAEARRLLHFLRLASSAYADASLESPLSLVVRPSVLGDELRRYLEERQDRVELPASSGRRWLDTPPHLRYPHSLWIAEIETDTSELASDARASTLRALDQLCRFFQLDSAPDWMADEVRKLA